MTTPAIERGAKAVEPYIGATAYPRDAVCVEAARGVLAAALDVEPNRVEALAEVIDPEAFALVLDPLGPVGIADLKPNRRVRNLQILARRAIAREHAERVIAHLLDEVTAQGSNAPSCGEQTHDTQEAS